MSLVTLLDRVRDVSDISSMFRHFLGIFVLGVSLTRVISLISLALSERQAGQFSHRVSRGGQNVCTDTSAGDLTVSFQDIHAFDCVVAALWED